MTVESVTDVEMVQESRPRVFGLGPGIPLATEVGLCPGQMRDTRGDSIVVWRARCQ